MKLSDIKLSASTTLTTPNSINLKSETLPHPPSSQTNADNAVPDWSDDEEEDDNDFGHPLKIDVADKNVWKKLDRLDIPGQRRKEETDEEDDDGEFFTHILGGGGKLKTRPPSTGNDFEFSARGGKLKSRPSSTGSSSTKGRVFNHNQDRSHPVPVPNGPSLRKTKSLYLNNFGISDKRAHDIFHANTQRGMDEMELRMDDELELILKKPLVTKLHQTPFQFMASDIKAKDWVSRAKASVIASGRQMLPPQSTQDIGKMTLVLDMDETLIHAKLDTVN